MTANSRAVQVQISLGTASQAGHQRAHDLRIGPQPDYVDAARTAQNRILVEPLDGPGLRKVCETRRSQRQTARAMKSNAAVCVSGIITFGHEAQPIFAALTPEQQDTAYREVAEAVAARIGTTVSGLAIHRDEAADHAHFQCPGFTLDGQPVSKIAKREALRDLQTIAAEIMGRHAPGIERGKSRWQRIEEGEDYAATVHRSAAEMRVGLTEELPALRARIEAARQKAEDNDRRAAKAREKAEKLEADATAGREKIEKLRRNIEAYDRRAREAREASESLTERLKDLTGTLTRLEGQKAALSASVAAQKAELAAGEATKADAARIIRESRERTAEARRQAREAEEARDAALEDVDTILDNASQIARKIVEDAEAEATRLIRDEVANRRHAKGYPAFIELMKEGVRQVFGDQGYERLKSWVMPRWENHPDNPERPVKAKSAWRSSGPSGP